MPKKSKSKKTSKVKSAVEQKETSAVSELPNPQEVKLVIDQQPSPTPTPPVVTPPADPQIAVMPATQPSPVTIAPIPESSTIPPQNTGESFVEPVIHIPEPTIETSPDDFEPEHHGNSVFKIILMFLTALIVGGGAVAGFFYYSLVYNPSSGTEGEVSPTQTPSDMTPEEKTASESAAENEAVSLNMENLSVQILNGSGIAGEATQVQTLLKEKQFAKFTLGNAETYNYTDTEVQVKEGTPASVFAAIQSVLADYTVVEKTALPESSDFDIVIIIGQQK